MPDAIALGPLVVPVLRLGALLAFVLGAWVAVLLADRRNLDREWTCTTVEYGVWIGIVGARLGFVALHWSAYADAPWTALYLWQPGYSGTIGLAVAAIFIGWRVWSAELPRPGDHVRVLGMGFSVAVLLYAGLIGSMRLDFGDQTLRAGDVAPEITLIDLSGQTVRFSDLRGQAVVLNFWATWCPPCRREMPLLDDVHDAYAARDVAIVGVDVAESPATVAAYVGDTGVDYPIWLDGPTGSDRYDRTQSLLRRFGGIGLPTTVFIDADGVVRATQVGELSRGILVSRIEMTLRAK